MDCDTGGCCLRIVGFLCGLKNGSERVRGDIPRAEPKLKAVKANVENCIMTLCIKLKDPALLTNVLDGKNEGD